MRSILPGGRNQNPIDNRATAATMVINAAPP